MEDGGAIQVHKFKKKNPTFLCDRVVWIDP